MTRWSFSLFLLVLGNASAADSMKLTLPEAVRLALAQNRALKIARLRVVENEQKKAAARTGYFPEIKNQSTVAHTTAEENIEIPSGAFGVIPNSGRVPNRDILINQGTQTFVTSGTMAAQPLTPLIITRSTGTVLTMVRVEQASIARRFPRRRLELSRPSR